MQAMTSLVEALCSKNTMEGRSLDAVVTYDTSWESIHGLREGWLIAKETVKIIYHQAMKKKEKGFSCQRSEKRALLTTFRD